MSEERSSVDWPELGSCCGCGVTGRSVNTIVILGVRAPVAGTGWGCFACHLPLDGAVAVLCETCANDDSEIRFACVGWPYDNVRIERAQLTEPFIHDAKNHPELAQNKVFDNFYPLGGA